MHAPPLASKPLWFLNSCRSSSKTPDPNTYRGNKKGTHRLRNAGIMATFGKKMTQKHLVKQLALRLLSPRSDRDHRGGGIILPHTCVINVVLNAMVKVNHAAILLASPGQPRHQPIQQHTSLFQSVYTEVNKCRRKKKKKIPI